MDAKKWITGFKGKELSKEFIRELIGNMVKIPGGSFLMGADEGESDERPIHNVLIDGFFLGRHVITQGQWTEVMETAPWENLKYICIHDRCPAVNINWYDVKTFIERLNKFSRQTFRLPTEAEWEYACRAGSSPAFHYGIFKFNLHKYAWYYENAFKKGEMYAHEVGTRKPNKWGLYDMQGNIYEWCSDWYRSNYYNKSQLDNPRGPLYGDAKVVRGGDWSRTDYFLRVTSRRHYSPHHKDAHVGFRLAMDAADMEKNNAGN